MNVKIKKILRGQLAAVNCLLFILICNFSYSLLSVNLLFVYIVVFNSARVVEWILNKLNSNNNKLYQ